MYLNVLAPSTEPLDMTASEEFASLVRSAGDLGLALPARVCYVARNVVANGLRFHALEWGAPGAPDLLLLNGGNQTAHSCDLVSLALSDRFRVVAVDQRGHGDSEWPRDGEASIDARAAAADRRRPLAGRAGGDHPAPRAARRGRARRAGGRRARGRGRREAPDPRLRPGRGGVRLARGLHRPRRRLRPLSEPGARRPNRALQPHAPCGRQVRQQARHAPAARGGGATPAPRGVTLEDVRAIACPVPVVRGESGVLTADAATRFAAALPAGLLVIDRPWPSMLRMLFHDPDRYTQYYWVKFGNLNYYFAGDDARTDEHGYIWLMGGVDDVINVTVHRLSTMEVESALVSHPCVAEAVVVGRPDEIRGEGDLGVRHARAGPRGDRGVTAGVAAVGGQRDRRARPAG